MNESNLIYIGDTFKSSSNNLTITDIHMPIDKLTNKMKPKKFQPNNFD